MLGKSSNRHNEQIENSLTKIEKVVNELEKFVNEFMKFANNFSLKGVGKFVKNENLTIYL